MNRWRRAAWHCRGPLATAVVMALTVPAGSTAAVAPSGTVKGRIRLEGRPPANPVIRMGADPACAAYYDGVRPVNEYVVTSSDGGVANAIVQIHGTFPPTPVPTTPVTIEQKGCVYHPHVVGLRAGQALRVKNDDQTLHNIHTKSSKGNDFNLTQRSGSAPLFLTIPHSEMPMRVTCDLHPWMNIFVAVLSHPYFAISTADGGFSISGVPAGHRVVEVWHELFGQLTVEVDVPAGGVVGAELTYHNPKKTPEDIE